ncbi:MAG: response regulator [Microcoleaceae cyanobacterium]
MTGKKLAQSILVVDDSVVMQQLLKEALEVNYRVFTVDNAIDALSMIYQKPISLLLLDISMPVINGLELCRTVRSLPQFHHLPIIMVTARDSAFDQVQGELAGATRYLTKPFDTQQLMQMVQTVLTEDVAHPGTTIQTSTFTLPLQKL